MEIVRQMFPAGVDMVELIANAELLAAVRAGIEPFMEPDFETRGDPRSIPVGSDTSVEDGPPGLFAKGIDGFVDFWREWNSAWESWRLGDPEFVDVDESRVLVSYEVRARPKTFPVEMTIEAANLITLRAGKVTRLELFFSRETAREAAGLS